MVNRQSTIGKVKVEEQRTDVASKLRKTDSAVFPSSLSFPASDVPELSRP